ncbi:transglycosylase SLT domain-containing protein [Oceanisphaera pacifica]|uniref:Transglycosylase SLT domain-containing protein n=1 Tax=Oceanisphaera pacifica TaxID=2818389 RepID=A0ABS3NGU9_9GAMM|nr:transglycosylase SLT domain-containing protein [Oceanisphaera pacifica]
MRKVLGLGLLLLGLSVGADASSMREQYRDAEQALDKKDDLRFTQLRKGLNEYPLAIYLDYQYLVNHLSSLRTRQVTDFIAQHPDSLLSDRLEGRYLYRLAREQRWREFLALYPELPNSVALQCAHYRAKWATGDKAIAMAGAKTLWLYGHSRPSSCDPLFSAWHKAGGRTDEDIWQRILLAYNSGENGLVSYLSRQLSTSAQPDAAFLQSLTKKPKQLITGDLVKPQNKRQTQALAQALAKLANTDYAKVMNLYPSYQNQAGLSQPQVAKIEQGLARRLMYNRTREYRSWLDSRLPEMGNDELFELRARVAIWEQDWKSLPQWIARLSSDAQQNSRWLYWRGRALKAQNKEQASQQAWQQAATHRNYYGFLAAQHLQAPFSLRKKPLVPAISLDEARRQWPAVARVEEWQALGKITAARSEWYHLLGKVSKTDGLALGSLALQQKWYDNAIQASIRIKAWDHLDLRFPIVYRDNFQRQAKRLQVSEATLFAIARQESAFYELARSPVGAGGLMQLMPATAKATAKKHGITDFKRASDVYIPNINIQLGSHYFKEMLERYSHNRIAAIAAYNAGPHRIDRWLKNSGSRPFDVWVENIPYRETRGYVQNVLAYSVIYQDILGQSQTLITPSELRYVY